MDVTDGATAIDDSFQPIHFRPAAAATGPGVGGHPLTNEGITLNGPRSGHWSVSSSINGSGIDNGCPTIHQFSHDWDSSGDRGFAGHQVRPIAGGVLRRLAEATTDDEKAQDERKSVLEITVEADAKRPASQVSKPPTAPKGFYVPTSLLKHGIRIKGKGGQDEVVQEPQLRPRATANPKISEKKEATIHKAASIRAPSPKPSVKTEKAASIVSVTAQRIRLIRIVSKNGEEAVMEIPAMPIRSKAASRVPSAKLPEADVGDKIAGAKAEAEKVERDMKAARAAKEIRAEREQEMRHEQERAIAAKVAAEVMMSGALPGSAQASTASKTASARSAKSSAKDSGVAFRVNETSKNPSVASSRTSIPRSVRPASVCSSPHTFEHAPDQAYKAPSSTGWKEIGVGETQKAPSSSASRRAPGSAGSKQPLSVTSTKSRPTPAQSVRSVAGFEEIKQHSDKWVNADHSKTVWDTGPLEGARWGSAHNSNQRSNSPSQEGQPNGSRALSLQNDTAWPSASPRAPQPPRNMTERTPTVFAGRGWISPHPLSRATSEVGGIPESVIQMPSGQGGTMTYEEWKAVQQSEKTESVVEGGGGHRNISATSSATRSRVAATWGFEGLHAASESPQGLRSNYHSPRVESVHGSHHSRASWVRADLAEKGLELPQQFDGAVDEVAGSRVQLRMPWDGR